MNGLEGRTLGEFKLLTKIGQGGMGTVYLAEQPTLNRRVAVKVLLPELAHDPEFPKRFKREAMLAASINHPGIVQVYAAGEEGDIYYIAMEYVDGEPLQRRMEREGRLKPDAALDIILSLAKSLDYAWQKARLIHRDVKPSNILISTDGEVKLADFGMAKNAECDSNLTATGMPIGTPLYISPELARCNREIDFASDIYSLGCTLYHLLCGRAPYIADASFAVMLLHVTEPPPSILQHMPDCPPAIVKLLARTLAKEPNQRHASYAELIEDLQRARGSLGKTSGSQRRVVALAGLAVVAGLSWYFGAKHRPVAAPPKPEPASAATATPGQKTAASPQDDAFAKSLAGLAPDAQAKRVIDRLKELNREFDPSTATYVIEDDAVTRLTLSITAITDLTPLRALKSLKRLNLGQAGQTGALSTLEGLRGLSLAHLECYNTTISDLEPLRGMPLKWLAIGGSMVHDLSPVQDCPLEALGINDSGVTDLGPVRGMPLKFLNCGVSQVSDLTPLTGMQLLEVNCSRTRVRDLSPLAGMELTRLICRDAFVEDLSVIRGMPLKEIDCDYVATRDQQLLRGVTTLERINGMPAAEFWRSQ